MNWPNNVVRLGNMKNVTLPELWYDSGGRGYWMKMPSNRFLCLDKKDSSVHLIHAGLDVEEQTGPLKAVDRVFMVSRLERAVDYAGPLAGHRVGAYVTPAGNRVLVTSEARSDVFEKPKSTSKNCPMIEKFLLELLGPEQLVPFLCWLKIARATLVAGDFRPGQLVVLAGPSNCGKSLCQALITEILGGRSAKPYRYMIGETSFNGDLAAAEHLMIEDESASTDIRARRKFGASIKDFTVCDEMSVHAKGRQAITLRTFKRLSLSVNDEAENLMILPPMDASLTDKIMLFKCNRANLQSDDRKENWRLLVADLPAFLDSLFTMRVPKAMVCPRFGIVAYHNPEILEMIDAIAPEIRLLNLIDEVLKESDYPWKGSAEELEKRLRSSAFGFAVEKLLYFSSATGTYLSRLAFRFPARFEARKNKGRTTWIIREEL